MSGTRSNSWCPLLLGALSATASAMASETQTFPVWPDRVPEAARFPHPESTIVNGDHLDIRNVSKPTVLAYLPDPAHATGMAVIVIPGSRMTGMDIKREGTDVAEFLNSKGIAAFILKHRLIPSGTTPEEFQQRINSMVDQKAPGAAIDGGYRDDVKWIVPLAADDLRQTVRDLRRDAARWKIDPNQIGAIGFSSGVLLVNAALLEHDAASRLNFGGVVHGYTVDAAKVPADAPPLFIACAHDDKAMPSTNCTSLYEAWRNGGHAAELHIYGSGTHNFNMIRQGLPSDNWNERFADWLGTLKARP